MKIVVAGGSGFLGNPLCWTWAEESHEVRVLTVRLRDGETQHESGTGRPGITRVGWQPDGTAGSIQREIDGAQVVINLAGESIASGRWTEARQQSLRDSRLLATRTLAAAITASAAPPQTLISGSAVGYYGNRGDAALTEDAEAGKDFLARLCADWESAAFAATRPGLRVVLLRTGIVLERTGGALQQMMRPFRFFVGGRLGSGRQYLSWIHRHDWIEMVRWLVDSPEVSGAVNATAPHPVTNAHFARALGRAMRRPALVPAPAAAIRLALGDGATVVLGGQRVLPARADAAGYHFRYPEVEFALRDLIPGSN